MHIGQKYSIFPLSPQLLNAPADTIEIVYELTRRREMQEGIFSATLTKGNTCFDDIAKVNLPDTLCPFGCKKKKCAFDWDVEKCPHDLTKKTTDELTEYMLKSLYYDDEDYKDTAAEYEKKVDPKLLEALKNFKRPGNYGTSRSNNNKV